MSTTVSGPAGSAPAAGPVDGDVVLRVENVGVEYDGERPTRAVRDVSFELRRGEVLGIAGESGCGKSTLAYAVTRMLRPPARLAGGSVVFRDRDGHETDLLALGGEELRAFRWNRVSMVFQSAMNALNPVTGVGRQFHDIFRAHRPAMTRAERAERTAALLEMVGIDPRRAHSYPHELSGGMRQRVVIAMALALEPDVVVMDEPTTALDVVVQREILDEVERLREELGFSVVFITHDLGLLMEVSDRLAVMYAGRIVEYAPAGSLAGAAHPYTRGLLRSFPDLTGARRELRGIPGSPPDLRGDIPGCAFADRCEHAFEPCRTVLPRLIDVGGCGGGAAGRAGTGGPTSGTDGRDAASWRAACHLGDPAHRPPDEPSSHREAPHSQAPHRQASHRQAPHRDTEGRQS